MKIRQNHFVPTPGCLAGLAILALAGGAHAADLTWTGPDPGTWDVATTANWSGATTTWTNGDNAIFNAGTYAVDIADGGVTVGNLTFGGGVLTLKSVTDNLGTIAIKSGGATWDTGGGTVEFLNDTLNDTPLSITSGDTLTVVGGGVFNTGEKPNGANWTAAGATLDVTGATIVRGNALSVGQFATVKMANGSFSLNQRNSNQTYGNLWDLGTGTVVFGSFYPRQTILSGVVSGSGRLEVRFNPFGEAQQDYSVSLQNAGNDFIGGVMSNGSNNTTILQITNANALGQIPVSLDVDNIKLRNGGYLRLNSGAGIALEANRGITLEGGGGIINTNGAHTLNGPITGTGGLEIGRAGDSSGNLLTLNSTASDYTGETTLTRGKIVLGAAGTLPAGTVVHVSGSNGGTSALVMNGNDQELAGLRSTGTNTRQLENDGASASTLTLNVPTGETPSYNGNFTGANTINIVKTGDGSQAFDRNEGYTSTIGNIAANGGTLIWNANNNLGTVNVAVSATLQIGNASTSGGIGTGAGAGNVGNGNITNSGTVIISRSDDTSYTGVISGSGSLTVTGGGKMTISSAQTYTGGTSLINGRLELTASGQVPTGSLVTFSAGGGQTSRLLLNGTSQTLGGLTATGSGTRQLVNTTGAAPGTPGVLTLDVADGDDFVFGSAVGLIASTDQGNFSLVKNGLGSQVLGQLKISGTVAVNDGNLLIGAANLATESGAVTVSGGNFGISGDGHDTPDLTVAPGATGSIDFQVTDWAGVAQTDYTQLEVANTMTVSSGAGSYTVVLDDSKLAGFVDTTASFTIATATTMSAVTADFAIDDSAFTLGTGSWSVAVVGSDVVLTYTSVADPYASWAQTNITNIQPLAPAGFDEDADSDGIDNGMEFVLNGNPLLSDTSILPTTVLDATNLKFSYTRRADSKTSTTQVVQWSTNLSSWTDIVVPPGDPDSVTIDIPRTNAVNGKLFSRLNVVR